MAIPALAFAAYQMMFAVITPALATGLRVEPQDEGALDARQQGMVAYNLSHALGFGHEAPREVRQPAGSGRAGAPAPGAEETLVTALIDLETTEVVELRKARCWPTGARTIMLTEAHVLTGDTVEVTIRNRIGISSTNVVSPLRAELLVPRDRVEGTRAAIDLHTHGGPRPAFTLDVGPGC